MFSYNVYCGLIILIELAEAFQKQGCLLKDIANKHGVPIEMLAEVLQRLVSVGFVEARGSMKEWLFLRNAPNSIYVYDIIKLFDNSFSGHFFDPKIGLFTKDSHMKRFLRKEHEAYERVMKNRIGRVTIDRYAQHCKINN